jgi:hypothetical protein
MKSTTQSLVPTVIAAAGGGWTTDVQHGQTRAFGGPVQPYINLQSRVRFREERERTAIVTSGVPRARTVQILGSVLRLPAFVSTGVEQQQLRVDLHRDDLGRWSHDYGLALAMSMVSSLTRRSIAANTLFLGDIDLGGGVRDVAPDLVDALNESIASFVVETPVTLLLAPSSAAWVRSSSTVRVIPCRTLVHAVAAAWPNVLLAPQ